MQQLEIITTQQTDLAVFYGNNSMDRLLDRIEQEALSLVPDVSTGKGRAEIKSLAYKVAQSKTALDNAGKQLVAEAKKKLAAVDAERKKARDRLDALKVRVRQPLTDWEQAEDRRVAALHGRLDELEGLAATDRDGVPLTADQLRASLEAAEATALDDSWQEVLPAAERAKRAVVKTLSAALLARIEHENQQAELARLRAEQEAKARAEREEQLRREGEERARREAEERERVRLRQEAEERARLEAREREARERAEREVREAQAAKERAEQEAKLAKEEAERKAQAAVEAERLRAEQERQARERERQQREADLKYRAQVIQEIAGQIHDLIGIPPTVAAMIVQAAADGEIHRLRVEF